MKDYFLCAVTVWDKFQNNLLLLQSYQYIPNWINRKNSACSAWSNMNQYSKFMNLTVNCMNHQKLLINMMSSLLILIVSTNNTSIYQSCKMQICIILWQLKQLKIRKYSNLNLWTVMVIFWTLRFNIWTFNFYFLVLFINKKGTPKINKRNTQHLEWT